ncbi:hypothetical protein rpr22_0805 [Rickettsia prowazekii str. Rp22]|uniref:Uncharacterized protein n=1 Tax=Rickettsia prowazekii (strain Rp22) TaxID=449216 RepID=D5AY22_RICPP|nr:hypothetical protein rpr22_0805 [Rickettsia prowazekii str. Rp22]
MSYINLNTYSLKFIIALHFIFYLILIRYILINKSIGYL